MGRTEGMILSIHNIPIEQIKRISNSVSNLCNTLLELGYSRQIDTHKEHCAVDLTRSRRFLCAKNHTQIV